MPTPDLHPRTLRRNIWRGLLSATDQEVQDGLSFYPGAHGLCRLLAAAHNSTTRQVAGIYAALSPMNTWSTNVTNTLDVLRYAEDRIDNLKVNTSGANREKALRIALGEDPEAVLRGRKVLAFFRGMANPEDTSPIAVDRHLINLAVGLFPEKNQQSRLASSPKVYSKVESAYLELGRREGLGNRLAAIAWFVQRRLARTGQMPLPHPDSPICCQKPMYCHGVNRFYCSLCRSTQSRSVKAPKPTPADLLYDIEIPSDWRISAVGETPIIYPPSGDPIRPRHGWLYLSRWVVMNVTGETLRRDEHVHHRNGIKMDCRIDNLEVLLAERHGKKHAHYQLLYMLRDRAGRFISSQVPPFSQQIDTEGLRDAPF